MEFGITQAEVSLGSANTAAERTLALSDSVRSQARSLADMAVAEAEGRYTDQPGKGVVYHRLMETSETLSNVYRLLDQAEIDIRGQLDSASIEIQRMRRAIPAKGDPLEGLEAYSKARRGFETEFQKLAEQNVALKVRTALDGIQDSLITSDSLHLAKVNRDINRKAERLMAAFEDQSIKIERPEPWSIGSPVYLSLLYIKHGWTTVLLVILLEAVCPLFLLWSMWAKHRERIGEDLDSSTVDLKQLEMLTKGVSRILEMRDEAAKSKKDEEESNK